MTKIIKGSSGEDPSALSDPTSVGALSGDRPVLKGDIVLALETAERIVKDAKEKATGIIVEARREESAIREKAVEEGREEGLRRWVEAIRDCREKYRRMMESGEPEMLKISLKVAERIVGKALEMDPAVIIDIIHQALNPLKYQKEIRIRIHTQDLAVLKANKLELLARLGENKEIDVVDDPLVPRGGCIIDTEIGTIDARLDTQLRVFEKFLQNRRSL